MDKDLNQQLSRTVAALSKNTPTKAGATDSRPGVDKVAVMDAIDQVFGQCELVYHNQYTKAFPTQEKLDHAKKLWFGYLREYPAERILKAAERAVRVSEFLPSVASILKYCDGSPEAVGLPDVRSAYCEACLAPEPKSTFGWTSPAVYYAGKATGWHLLANRPEHQALPIFTKHYEAICQRLARGEELPMPALPKASEAPGSPLSNEEKQLKLKALRKETGF